MSQAAMDAGAFAEMKEMMGENFSDIVSLCLQSLPDQINGIESAINETNAEQLFNIAHKMKSASGSIGAYGLAEKVEILEMIGRDGSTDVPEQALKDLCEAADQVIAILNKEISS